MSPKDYIRHRERALAPCLRPRQVVPELCGVTIVLAIIGVAIICCHLIARVIVRIVW
jgi:hypothetical protein